MAQDGNLGIDQAFTALRGYSRDHNPRLSDLAAAVVTRELPPRLVLDHARAEAATPGCGEL